MTSKKTGLELLREPFPPHQISLLPKPYKKDSTKGNCKVCGGYHGLPAAHLNYVGHAALTDRLLDADPAWTWEPLALTSDGLPLFDASGGLWIKLTVCGVTRLGYGNAEKKDWMDAGAREKEVIGDAMRNSAMRFGAALDLWFKGGDLHKDKDSDDDKPAETSTSPDVDRWAQLIQTISTPEAATAAITEIAESKLPEPALTAIKQMLWHRTRGELGYIYNRELQKFMVDRLEA